MEEMGIVVEEEAEVHRLTEVVEAVTEEGVTLPEVVEEVKEALEVDPVAEEEPINPGTSIKQNKRSNDSFCLGWLRASGNVGPSSVQQ